MKLLRLLPLERPADRARRLVFLVIAGVALLVLTLWDPIAAPGPVICGARRAFGVPCPFCGVTRGVSLCLRGRPVEASGYNPLTVPIFVVGLGLMVVWAIEYIAGARIVMPLSARGTQLVIMVALVIVLAGWTWMLCYRREDEFSASWLGLALRQFW
jgi:hypothetical protein